METEEAVDEGRQSGETGEVKLTDDTEVVEDKGSGDKGGNAKELVSTARPESTARPDIDAARQEDSAVEPRTPLTTTSIFDDEDITMAQTLIKMKEEKAKEKRNPKDKGKGVLKESPVKKVKRIDLDAAQIANDAEIARLVHEKELAEMERKNEKQTIILTYTSEERAKFLAEIIAAQRKFRATQRSTEIRKEELIKKMNEKETDEDASKKEKVSEEPKSTKDEVKKERHEENIRKRSGRRLKMKATKKSKRQKTNSDLEEEEQLRAYLKIVPDEEEEIDYEVLGMRVFRANGSSRYIKTFTEMVSRFDRLDFIELHSLVMHRFSTTTPEGINLVLWGDLRIMFEETTDDDIWKNQEK
ncbi:hypothetical protein Tco_0945285 [Tanacetum coccineum]